MLYEEPVSWDNGEDIHLSYSIKKFGNIESYVIPHPDQEDFPNFGVARKGPIMEVTIMHHGKKIK